MEHHTSAGDLASQIHLTYAQTSPTKCSDLQRLKWTREAPSRRTRTAIKLPGTSAGETDLLPPRPRSLERSDSGVHGAGCLGVDDAGSPRCGGKERGALTTGMGCAAQRRPQCLGGEAAQRNDAGSTAKAVDELRIDGLVDEVRDRHLPAAAAAPTCSPIQHQYATRRDLFSPGALQRRGRRLSCRRRSGERRQQRAERSTREVPPSQGRWTATRAQGGGCSATAQSKSWSSPRRQSHGRSLQRRRRQRGSQGPRAAGSSWTQSRCRRQAAHPSWLPRTPQALPAEPAARGRGRARRQASSRASRTRGARQCT